MKYKRIGFPLEGRGGHFFMKVLMLTWEFPPFITGGLGMACYGLVRSLLLKGVQVLLVLPSETLFYFHLKKIEDADNLPQVFLTKKPQKKFETVEQRLIYYGVSSGPGVYKSSQGGYGFTKSAQSSAGSENIFKKEAQGDPNNNFYGHEDTFRQMNVYTVRLLQLIRHLDFDVIHAHDWVTYPAALSLRSFKGKPLVCHIHSTEFDRAGGTGDSRIHAIEKSGLTMCDRVITVSKYTSSIIVNKYGIDPSKIRVIYNAYQIHKKRLKRTRIFKDPVVLFLGRITLQKGPEYFLRVAKKVIDLYPDVRFIMAGEGDMEKALIYKSARYKLHTRFLFTGFLKRNDVERILSASDIILLPSVSEPFGIAPLEAMSFGVAALISKQSGVSEIVQNAYKINFWDIDQMAGAIISLVKDPQKLKKVGEAGAKEVEKIGWDKAGSSIKKAYEELTC